jgi:hypothetical protein
MRDLNRIIKKVIRETHEEKSQRYMFFSNLEQMRRQCDILLDMDHSQIEDVLDHGHDWADDHITVSKENLDQVFDFLMNYTKNNDMETSMIINDVDIMEGRKKTGTPLCARGKASAKAKYDVYPSAYSNGHAVQVCKGKIKGLDGKRHCSGAYC